jgi:hypothetical protein
MSQRSHNKHVRILGIAASAEFGFAVGQRKSMYICVSILSGFGNVQNLTL